MKLSIAQTKALWKRSLSKTSFSSHIILTMGTNFLMALLALATGSLVARLLGPHGRGELAAIQTWAGLIATIATLGLSESIVYFSSRFPKRAGEYLTSGISLAILNSVVFIAIGYFLMPVLLAAQSETIIASARWYLLLFVPLQATQGMFLQPLRGRNDFAVWNILRPLYTIGWLLVLLLAYGLNYANPTWLAMGQLAVLAILAIPVLMIVRRRVPGSFRPHSSFWRPMLRFGLPSVFSSVPQLLNLRLDQMLMAGLLPPESLGLYAVAVAWSGAMLPMISAVGAVLFPRVASQTSHLERTEVLMQGTRIGSLVAISLGVISFIITPVILPWLFGTAFIPAISAALLLVVAGVISSMNMVLQEGARGLGQPKIVLWSESTGLVMTTVVLALSLRSLGILGAALASFCGYATTMIVMSVYLHRVISQPITALLLPGFDDIKLVKSRIMMLVGF
jgi:O-antigen/teichoic acid export membrane protein